MAKDKRGLQRLSLTDAAKMQGVHHQLKEAIRTADDPGAMVGGFLPLVMVEALGLDPEEHGSSFHITAAAMILMYVKKYDQPETVKDMRSLCSIISGACSKALSQQN